MSTNLMSFLTYVVTFLGGVICGVVLQFFISKRDKGDVKSNDIVLMAVTVVWTLTRMISLLNTQIIVSPALDALMGGLVGYFYKGSIQIWKKPGQK